MCVCVHVRLHVSVTWICMIRFARKGLKCVVSRHSFHHHLIAKSTDQQDMCIIQINSLFLLRLFSQACWTSMRVWVIFKWFWWDLTDSQPAVNYHITAIVTLTIALASFSDNQSTRSQLMPFGSVKF